MSQTFASQTVDGVELPAQGTWSIDPSHSTVGFVARHLMVTKVRGQFAAFTGELQIGESPERSRARVTIDAASIDTRDEKRDGHLRSADFLDVENHPTLEFVSTSFHQTGARTFDLAGELTIRGVTRSVVLHAEYEGLTLDPWGGTRVAFTAETDINREDFGLTWNVALETGGVLVSKQIKIQLDVQAVYQA